MVFQGIQVSQDIVVILASVDIQVTALVVSVAILGILVLE